jgi:metallo-beta-lactamase family protein
VQLHFWGANRQVTGSRYCLEAAGRRILIDCGLFQERDYLARNWEDSPLPVDQFDALVLTHAHLDHCGLIPRLVDAGFRAEVHCTRPTVDLTELVLLDAAQIQEEDAAYKLRRHAREGRRGQHPPVALYTTASVPPAMAMFRGHAYGQALALSDDIRVTFHDAGHILGSAILEFSVREAGRTRRVVFSGDVGQAGKPFLRDPARLSQADYLVLESTYGDRYHEKGGDIAAELAMVVNKTVERGGNVVIPTFAVERAQDLMYVFSRLVHENRIPDVPIFLDSPMAVDVTAIFGKYQDCFDPDTWGLILRKQPPLHFPGLKFVRTAEQSKAINSLRTPCVIMASSGMCTAGRVKHHLRQNVERPESTVLFVGYQAHGTLGRQILDRQPRVRIHGRDYRMRAEVAELNGFSGHADRAGLLQWLEGLAAAPQQIFLTHGEASAAASLAEAIHERFRYPATIPEYRSSVTLE